jgi:hypothetical protein
MTINQLRVTNSLLRALRTNLADKFPYIGVDGMMILKWIRTTLGLTIKNIIENKH